MFNIKMEGEKKGLNNRSMEVWLPCSTDLFFTNLARTFKEKNKRA